MLVKLGWLELKENVTRRPRLDDMRLVAGEVLLNRRAELIALMKSDARLFIASVFCSDNQVWWDRCQSIVREK